MVNPETAETEANGSGVLSDAATADAPTTRTTEPEPDPESAVTTDQPQVPEAPTTATQPGAAPTTSTDPEKKRSLRDVRPSALVSLCLLGVLAALSIIGGLVFGGDTALGKTCVIGLVPAFSIAIGVVVTHWYSKRGLDEQLASAVQNAMYTTLHLKRSVQYVDDRLGTAQEHLQNRRGVSALLEVVRAKTATELSLGTAQQSSRQWESISKTGAQAAQSLFVEDDDELRPRIREGDNPKTVAPSDETAGKDDESA